MAIETLADYSEGRIIFLLSKASSNFEQTIKAAGQLEVEYDERLKRIWTHEKDSITQERIAEALRAGDILVCGTGDGGDAVAVNGLYKLPDELQRTPVLSWYGGNANMGPGELVPKNKTMNILDAISNGIIIDNYPLVASVTADNETIAEREEPFPDLDKLIVLYFGGMGLVGTCVKELEEARGEGLGSLGVESKAVRKARKDTKPFRISQTVDGRDEALHTDEVVVEFSAINGDRMAKFGRFPSSLDERQYFTLVIKDKRWRHILPRLAQLPLRMLPGQMLDGTTQTMVDFSVLNEEDRIYAQFDGELFPLAPKGSATFSQHEKPYRSVTTRYLPEQD